MKAQHFTHDVGFHIGTATMQTDYGTRYDFLSSYGESSINLSFTHTLHFFHRNPMWNSDHPIWSHVAVRSELNIIPSHAFRHYGDYVDEPGTLGEKLRAMTGTGSMTNVGFQIEYYLKCLSDFLHPYSDMKWNPYILGGLQFSMFNNTMESSLGDWRQDIRVLPAKWQLRGALHVGKGTTFAATFGAGIRRNISPKIDFNLQANWQFFFSDAVDGLQANVDENKYNEWLINIQFGIIYHLNFSRPLRIF